MGLNIKFYDDKSKEGEISSVGYIPVDTKPRKDSKRLASSGAVANVEEKVGDAVEALQEQIDDIAEKAGSGYTPKGEASVATLNGLSGQENGELYTMTDAGTLTDGSLDVVAGDTVAWDATNEVWYKAMDYAPRQYGTNEVHNLPTSITAFRTGDYIAVDGTNTAKMSKDALLALTSKNAVEVNAAPIFSDAVNYAVGQFVTYDGKLKIFKTAHPAGAWNASHVLDVPVVTLDDSGIIANIDKTFTYPYSTAGVGFRFYTYLPACGKYDIVVDCTGGATFNFSLKDYNDNNVVTYAFSGTHFEATAIPNVACICIGFWKNSGENTGTLTLKVKSKSVYDSIEDVKDDIDRIDGNISDITDDISDINDTIKDLRQIVKKSEVSSDFENVQYKGVSLDYAFEKGHFYKVVLSCSSPQYPTYFSMSVKNTSGKNIYTSARNFYYGYEPLELLFFADDTLVKVASWLQFNSPSDNSGTIKIEVFDLPICCAEAIQYQSVRPMILDTDFAWDVDDAFAIRMMSWGVATGKIDLVCCLLSKLNDKSVSALDGALCEEGLGPCRIGKTNYAGTERTFHTLFADFPNHKLTSNSQSGIALDVLRESLQNMPIGNKCDIVVLGTLVNISALINYQATSDSLSGLELLSSRVRRIWIMGGNLRSGETEANFREYPNDTYNVLENCPVPLYIQGADFTTWDFSTSATSLITEGANLNSVLGNNDYIYRAFETWKAESGQGISIAYDPMLLLTAIEDNEYLTGITYKRGHINFDVNTKTQTFTESADGNHYVMYRSFPSDVDFYKAKLKNIFEKRQFLAEKPRIFRIGT